MFKVALRIAALLFFVSQLLGCIGFVGPEIAAPATLGSNPVGVTTMTVNDPSRDRQLTVEVWYPAYAPRAGDDQDELIYSVRGMGGTVARLRSPAGAHRDVDARREGGPYPVVLLSHGSGSSRFGNVTLAEVLASHGYIVAAPDHEGHTLDDQVLGISYDQRAQTTLDRPLDLSRVLDALERRSLDPNFVLSGLVDPSRVAVAGHSFGGTTALGMVGARFDAPRQKKECEESDKDDRLCHVVPVLGPGAYRYRDPRVKAAVLIAPGGYDLYRDDGIAQVDAPTLVVAGMLDEGNKFLEYPKPIYDALQSPHYLLKLEKAGHLTSTDVCEIVDSIGFLAKTFGGKDAVDGCGGAAAGFMSTRRANDRVARATLAFLDLVLNDNTAAEHDLQVALAPDVETETRRKQKVAKVSAR